MTRTPKTRAVKTAQPEVISHLMAAPVEVEIADVWKQGEASEAYENLNVLAAYIQDMPIKARAANLPKIVRMIAEILK